HLFSLLFLILRRHPTSPLFPYTTLFRSAPFSNVAQPSRLWGQRASCPLLLICSEDRHLARRLMRSTTSWKHVGRGPSRTGIGWKPNFLHSSQHRDRLAQIAQRFHYRSVFPPDLFRNRNMPFVAIEERLNNKSAMSCPRGQRIAIDKLNQMSGRL